MAASGGFVAVAEHGQCFHVDGRPFFFAGANSYYLMTRAAEENLRHEVTEILDSCVKAGLTVVRTWAFNDGEKEWNALQPQPGVFDEKVFRGLDWLIAEAAKRRLRLILTLTNYWEAYGGMLQYVRWSCQRRGLPVDDKLKTEQFYTDPACQDIYSNMLATVTSRVNTFTGCAYRDDPTIMAWTLANEPRCDGDYSASVLQGWLARASEFLKSLDPNHLVAGGSEGFLGSSTPDLLPDNPYDTLRHGCDFLRHNSLPCIDFCTLHLWVDSWLPKADEEHRLNFARRWLNCHADLCSQHLRKPLVLAEFGKAPGGPVRTEFYERVYARVLHHAKAGHGLAGSCLWSVAHSEYEDYDGYTVYLSAEGRGKGKHDDAATVRLVRSHAAEVAALSRQAEKECCLQ